MSNVTLAMVLVGGLLLAQDGPSAGEETLKKLNSDHLATLLKAADADGNGTLNNKEFRTFVPAIRKVSDKILNELDPSIAKKKADKDLKKYDTDRDNSLSDSERKAMDEAKRLKSIKDFDWDEDGKLNEREKTAMQWAEEGQMDAQFRKADTDANGELNEKELSAALAKLCGIKIKKAK